MTSVSIGIPGKKLFDTVCLVGVLKNVWGFQTNAIRSGSVRFEITNYRGVKSGLGIFIVDLLENTNKSRVSPETLTFVG